jgi:HTH-type transcriptional regulator/antitoxin HigA
MEIKPVRNAKEHKAALAEVERLWDAKPGTSEHDRLEVLVTLIEAYEDKHEPIPPPDPIDAILFRMDQLDLDRRDRPRCAPPRRPKPPSIALSPCGLPSPTLRHQTAPQARNH